MASTHTRRGSTRRERRRARERAIVATTRALFDERGRRDAPVDEIARAAGMNKALIYRSFDSKEEIFVLTVTDYLAELEARGAELSELEDPAAALRQVCERYVGFCLEYPAFLDCALALMQRPAERAARAGLRCRVVPARPGDGRMPRAAGANPRDRRRARACSRSTTPISRRTGMYAQVLGSMHLARVGVGVREAAPGVAETFDLDPELVREACVAGRARARADHQGGAGVTDRQ